MEESSMAARMPLGKMIGRFAVLLGGAALMFSLGRWSFGLNAMQSTACGVFVGIVLGTLLFWEFRLAIAFLGLAVLVCTRSLTIPEFVASSSLDVILFLVGMMILVGALRDLGFFTWVIQLIVTMPKLTGAKFIAVTAFASALLACAVDEVTAIIFIATLIFQVCDRLKLNPTPYILIAVLATNVGSAGTMMGNPVGIYIGTRAGLSFGDFMVWSFPLMIAALIATIAVTLLYYRKELRMFDERLRQRLERGLTLTPSVDVPYKAGVALLIVVVIAIASHHQVEGLLHLRPNSMLIVAPLICAGIVMILRPHRARYYVEREVDWWTLIFFMLLFAVAGTLEHTGVAERMAEGFTGLCGSSDAVLVPSILGVSAIGSAFVDNVIFVAAFAPVIDELAISTNGMPLWWALLFGACFGGNITMIGSTANIVALGMLEKKAHVGMKFFQWLKIGLVASAVSLAVTGIGIYFLSPMMPERAVELKKAEQVARVRDGKLLLLHGSFAPLELLTKPANLPADVTAKRYFTWPPAGEAEAVPDLIVACTSDAKVHAAGSFTGKFHRAADGKEPAVLVADGFQPDKKDQ